MIKLNIIIIYLLIVITYSQTLPTKYNIIGPFPIGEREEGLDSLEAYGGILNIPIGDNSLYPSELGNGGKVGWISMQSSTAGSLSLDWSQYIDWQSLQQVWGWNIWLWYGYAVGTFTVATTSTYTIQCSATRTYYIVQQNNGTIYEFTGDFYGYGVGQQVVNLQSGTTYQFIVRMDSSVRLNQSPMGEFNCQLNMIPNNEPALVLQSEGLVSDIVDGKLSSPYATVTILNVYSSKLDELGVSATLSDQSLVVDIVIVANSTISAVPGQKVSIPLHISIDSSGPLQCPLSLSINIQSSSSNIATTTLELNCTTFSSPYLFTFLDYDNTVQYAIAYPPSTQNCQGCGVMIATHGAGVEASAQMWMDAIQQQPNLWILYPTGRRSWGYDWESASRINVFSALNYLANSLPGVDNSSMTYSIDTSKIVFVGHSMGGHGCWSLLSHFPDLVMGGACAAGFVKLQFYVFMNTRPGFSYVDPILQGMLMSSIAENDNDLYSTNLVGIPLMARYGQNDTNVNPWHSRRMARMTAEQSGNASAVIISEVPNQGHWFPGILGDDYMQQFYQSLQSTPLFVPPIPKTITITTNNPASSGQRANIIILQTTIPYRVGRIQLVQLNDPATNQLIWVLSTQNVRRFGITTLPARNQMPTLLHINSQTFDVDYYPDYHYTSPDKYGSIWNVSDDTSWLVVERHSQVYGPMRQIFEKPFSIVYGTNVSSSTQQLYEWAAVYISNTFNTYGRGSPQIIADIDFIPPSSCSPSTNYILLGGLYENSIVDKYESILPVQYYNTDAFSVGPTIYSDSDQGIAYLAPNECNQGLLLVVSGNSNQGFVKALKSIPMRSGVVAPDYIVVGSDWGWKGAGGIVSTGFWGNTWDFSTDNSYLGMNTHF